MNVIARITGVGNRAAGSGYVYVEYACESMSTSLVVTVDLTMTEAVIRDDVRAAVVADSNSKCEMQVTVADVRLL